MAEWKKDPNSNALILQEDPDIKIVPGEGFIGWSVVIGNGRSNCGYLAEAKVIGEKISADRKAFREHP